MNEYKDEETLNINLTRVTKQEKYSWDRIHRVECEDSQIGTEEARLYSQEVTNKENSDEPTKARNWIWVMLMVLLSTMLPPAVHCLTGMAPNIMYYLMTGVQIIMYVKSNTQNSKKKSTTENQEGAKKTKTKNLTTEEQLASQTHNARNRKLNPESRVRNLDTDPEIC